MQGEGASSSYTSWLRPVKGSDWRGERQQLGQAWGKGLGHQGDFSGVGEDYWLQGEEGGERKPSWDLERTS